MGRTISSYKDVQIVGNYVDKPFFDEWQDLDYMNRLSFPNSYYYYYADLTNTGALIDSVNTFPYKVYSPSSQSLFNSDNILHYCNDLKPIFQYGVNRRPNIYRVGNTIFIYKPTDSYETPVVSSDDGLTFSNVSFPFASSSYLCFGCNGQVFGIVNSDAYNVSRFYLSTDCINWTEKTTNPITPNPSVLAPASMIMKDNIVCFYGYQGDIYTSTNGGETFTMRNVPVHMNGGSAQLKSFVFGNKLCFSYGNTLIYSSNNGNTWQETILPYSNVDNFSNNNTTICCNDEICLVLTKESFSISDGTGIYNNITDIYRVVSSSDLINWIDRGVFYSRIYNEAESSGSYWMLVDAHINKIDFQGRSLFVIYSINTLGRNYARPFNIYFSYDGIQWYTRTCRNDVGIRSFFGGSIIMNNSGDFFSSSSNDGYSSFAIPRILPSDIRMTGIEKIRI